MTTIIVPDVHERLDQLDALEDRLSAADRVVFLGDFFDKFGNRYSEQMARWLVENLGREGWEFLLGNHDASYRWPTLYACSGYQNRTQEAVWHTFGRGDNTYWREFKLFTEVAGYTLSHAGFVEETKHFKNHNTYQTACDASDAGHYCGIFGAGRARGGHQDFGGPIWLDWNHEFEPVDGMLQIVGHTYRTGAPREKSGNWCIDNGINSVMQINEDGTHEFITV